MAEKLYTIPVNEAFDSGAECPVCAMFTKLENDSIDFMMGPSYREDDIRMDTNKMGFCKPHMRMLAVQKNRLGLALILKTHLDEQKKQALSFKGKQIKPKTLLKKPERSDLAVWCEKQSESCYICSRIKNTFGRYIDTVLHLYKKDPEFRKKYESCKGFCQEHMGMLIDKGQEILSQDMLNTFYQTTLDLYTENLQRLADDLDWFTDKFDYRYKDAPWKNSRDAIERAVTKTNGIIME